MSVTWLIEELLPLRRRAVRDVRSPRNKSRFLVADRLARGWFNGK
jgi:hypothetical protein